MNKKAKSCHKIAKKMTKYQKNTFSSGNVLIQSKVNLNNLSC